MPALRYSPPSEKNWWEQPPPKDVQSAVQILGEHEDDLNSKGPEGIFLRKIYRRLKEQTAEITQRARAQSPISFAKLSYEQVLKCNAWIAGINFIIDFDANRKGKTAFTIFNALLFILPNDPEWVMFKPYMDDWDREVRLFQRPSISNIVKLRNYLKLNPHLQIDPLLQPYEAENAEKFATLQKELPNVFRPAFPYPTYKEPSYTGWHGAPDADYHKQIIMPEWRKWLPKASIVRDSEYDKELELVVEHPEGRTEWDILFKSYESKDTKWSGAAVGFVIMTEGVKKETLDEIKQRYRSDAFSNWDYTPYEPRNTGQKTSLAYKVYQGKEELPLRPFVFSGFGIEKTPDFILPEEKRQDLIRVWAGKDQGKARIKGEFYTSSPVALTNLDTTFHTLPWSKEELFERHPEGRIYRGFDPGYDHPCACAWGILTKTNCWFIYRIYSKAGTSIGQRCRDVIELSGNTQSKVTFGTGEDDFYLVETHSTQESEAAMITIADYHVFKADEKTKQPYAANYTREGLVLTASQTYGPRERAQMFDRKLEKSLLLPHPIYKKPPGSKVYFLINEDGIAEALDKMENIFWDRYATGERKGEPKDELQDFDDDEFDAVSYLVTSPYRWSTVAATRRHQVENIANPRMTRQFRNAPTFAGMGY